MSFNRQASLSVAASTNIRGRNVAYTFQQSMLSSTYIQDCYQPPNIGVLRLNQEGFQNR